MNFLRLAAPALLFLSLFLPAGDVSAQVTICSDDKTCPVGTYLVELPPKEECTIKECLPIGAAVNALIECTANAGVIDCVAWPKGAALSYAWNVSGQLAVNSGGGGFDYVSLTCRGDALKGYSGTATLGLTVNSPGRVKSKTWTTIDCAAFSDDGQVLF